MSQAHHLNIKELSLTTVVPWMLGFIGLGTGGFLSDALGRVIGDSLRAKKIVLAGCLALSAVCVAVSGTVTGTIAAVSLMSLSVFFLYITGHAYWAIIQDTVPPARVGAVGGFVHLLATLAGVLGPAITGFIVQISGVYTSAFVLAGIIAGAGAIGVWVFVQVPSVSSVARPTGGT